MPKCIYCLKDDLSTTFNSREHVIPKSLGRFAPLNPTISGRVCDNCNSLFSPLEVNFTEDTYEGVFGQRLNIDNRGSIIIRDVNYKIERVSGFGEGFFMKMFPFLECKDGKIVPILKSQIKFKRRSGGYRIFFPETLENLPKGTKRFKRIINDLRNLDQKGISIFAENRQELESIIKLLHSLGIKYKEKKSYFNETKKGDKILVDEKYTCSINKDVARVIAKIAFNYFAYCAMRSDCRDVLFLKEFDDVRNFIHSGDGGEMKDFILSISEESILKEERDEKKRFIAHFITFLQEEGRLYARVTFFGLPPVYKINFGVLPKELNRSNFGCGHVFNPFDHTIYNLSQMPFNQLTEDQIQVSFGLFKSILNRDK
ncbi:MAG: hypothetical protein KAI72_05380 [Candidatus Pacebacteria bacterium]|nr:hypothetical protein [Candidatus Paceibacterota bacterium]